jgi:hypothetical protein
MPLFHGLSDGKNPTLWDEVTLPSAGLLGRVYLLKAAGVGPQLVHILGPAVAGTPPLKSWEVPTEKLDISFLTLPWQIGHFTWEL